MHPVSSAILDKIKDRLLISDIVGRVVRLKRKGKDHLGLCPFHAEKTPSFTVNDSKGFYHCFGCGAHGSIFDFLMENEKLSFKEALEKAAALANVELPKNTPYADASNERSKNEKNAILSACATAALWFKQQFLDSQGKFAREYVKRRGLSQKTVQHFELGFAPPLYHALTKNLLEQKIDVAIQAQAGLVIIPDEKEKEPFDRFRERLIFPIHDASNNVVAFGGRSLRSDIQPKYLNSPDTPLFQKGELLYNFYHARMSKEQTPLLVVEGYMDVISLYEHGYGRAVAPLGTALTESQILLLWKIDQEPIIVFDGDRAGQMASERVIERALPLLKPGFSLSFLSLPLGEDPDSLIQKISLESFQLLVGQNKVPLVQKLWEKLSLLPHETPEQRAFFEREMFKYIHAISNPAIKKYYQEDLTQRFSRLKPKKYFERKKESNLQRMILPPQKNIEILEKVLIALFVQYPSLIEEKTEALSQLSFSNKNIQDFSLFFLDNFSSFPLEKEALFSYLSSCGYERLLKNVSVDALAIHAPFLKKELSSQEASQKWDDCSQQIHMRLMEEEKEMLKSRLTENPTEENWNRYQMICKLLEKRQNTIDN